MTVPRLMPRSEFMAIAKAGRSNDIQQDMARHVGGNASSRLLSLPKELRLEIWKHVLTDAKPGSLMLRILRDTEMQHSSSKRFANSLYKHPEKAEVATSFEYGKLPRSTIGVTLLRVDHLIYAEAFPVLYHAVSFYPLHLEGVLPLFSEKLSAFAKPTFATLRSTLDSRTLPLAGCSIGR